MGEVNLKKITTFTDDQVFVTQGVNLKEHNKQLEKYKELNVMETVSNPIIGKDGGERIDDFVERIQKDSSTRQAAPAADQETPSKPKKSDNVNDYQTIGHYVSAHRQEVAESLGMKDAPLWGKKGLVEAFAQKSLGVDSIYSEAGEAKTKTVQKGDYTDDFVRVDNPFAKQAAPAAEKKTAPAAEKQAAPAAEKQAAPAAEKQAAPAAEKKTAPAAEKKTAPTAEEQTSYEKAYDFIKLLGTPGHTGFGEYLTSLVNLPISVIQELWQSKTVALTK